MRSARKSTGTPNRLSKQQKATISATVKTLARKASGTGALIGALEKRGYTITRVRMLGVDELHIRPNSFSGTGEALVVPISAIRAKKKK